jgi:polyisoprenoid-binding protein YceI
MRFTILLLCLVVSTSGFADWLLDGSQSRLHFVTTKATHVAEVHRFKQLSGSVSDQGAAEINIDLNSVDTQIEIRDERMKEMLFEVLKYPNASLIAKFDASLLSLKAGESKVVPLEGKLTVRGQSVNIVSSATVNRLSDTLIAVSSESPIIVNAKDLDLIAGIEKLREVAGLPSISYSVAVTYDFKFEKQ